MTTKEQQITEAVAFWRALGHKPGDGCDPDHPWGGARREAWRAVHTVEAVEKS